MTYRYFNCCVSWAPSDVNNDGGLSDMIDNATDITRKTFLRHVDQDQMREIESDLGYERHRSRGLTMADDWHVSYHRSKLHENCVYFFRHSAIEYVFCGCGE